MKKRISLFLATVLLLCCFMLPGQADSIITPGSKYPTVYVPGKNEDILVNDIAAETPENIRGNIAVNVPEFISALAPKIVSGLTTHNWDSYCDALEALVSPMFSSVVLGNNGLPTDNSGVLFDTENVVKRVQSDYSYRIDTYYFEYDYRLDPYDNAAVLDSYIQSVLKATGASRVNLLGRCEGANIVLAYLEKYGNTENVSHILFAWPAVYGICGITSFFTGEISLDADALAVSLAAENTLNDIARAAVQIAGGTGLSDSAADLFNRVYAEVKDRLMPRLVLDTYGTMPSFWAMIAPEKYEQAKSFVFAGKEDEYAGLIEKIDYYHTHAGSNAAEILKRYTDAGVMFSCVAKYGFPGSSLCSAYKNYQTDGMAITAAASLGATVSDFGSELSAGYIAKARENGSAKYISPDRIIDASTCLYPASTWFVKNAEHSKMPDALKTLCAKLLASEVQPTVDDSGRYPQYLLYDGRAGMLSPLDEYNDIDKADNVPSNTDKLSFFDRIIAFFRSIIDFFTRLFSLD